VRPRTRQGERAGPTGADARQPLETIRNPSRVKRLLATACLLVAAGATTAAGAGAAGPPDGRTIPDIPSFRTGLPLDGRAVPSAGRELFTLPWGDGEGEVGLADPAEGLRRGPEALAVAADGRLAVLDSVNRRLLLFDPAGRLSAGADLPLPYARWLAVDESAVYVLQSDPEGRVASFSWSGSRLSESPVPLTDDPVTGFFCREGRLFVEILHESVLELTPDGLGSLTGRSARGRPLDARAGRQGQLEFREGSLFLAESPRPGADPRRAPISLERGIAQALSLDADGQGNMVLGLLAEGGAELLVARMAAAGGLPAALTLPNIAGSIELGALYHLGADGAIYQPGAGPSGYTVRVHEFPERSDR
jgi:hypothetical protein